MGAVISSGLCASAAQGSVGAQAKVRHLTAVLALFAIVFASFPTAARAQYTHRWSQLIGGSGNSQVYGTAIDRSSDAIYAIGSFDGELRLGPFTFNTSPFTTDIFLVKLNAAGDVLWAKQYQGFTNEGNAVNDSGDDVTTDAAGNVYAIGTVAGDVVVRRVDPTTGNDVWSQTFGNPAGVDQAFAIEANGSLALIAVGIAGGAPVSFGPAGTFTSVDNGYDIVMAGLNASNGSVAWARHYPTPGTEAVKNSALDQAANRIVIVGSADRDLNLGTGPLPNAGLTDAFIASYAAADGAPIWARSYGGSGFDDGRGVVVDSNGNVYVTGYHNAGGNSGINFGGGSLPTYGSIDAFVAKLTREGAVIWAQSHGGTGDDYGNDIAVGSDGNIAIVGHFQLTASFGGAPITAAGQFDPFLAAYNANGQHLWSSAHGSAVSDKGFCIAAGNSGDYVAGGFTLHEVNFGGGVLRSDGYADGFLAKFNSTSGPVVSTSSLSGRVAHFALGVGVPGVTVSVTNGATTRSAVTNANGDYLVTNIPEQGQWNVSLSKDGDIAQAVSALDASFILNARVGLMTLTADQLLAADVSGDGSVSAHDAAQVLQFRTGTTAHVEEAVICESDWLFVRDASADFSVTNAGRADGHCAENTLQGMKAGANARLDFRAIGLGDVSVNWSPQP